MVSNLCFIFGNLTVLMIIILTSMRWQKIDFLFTAAVFLLTIGTILTGAFTSGDILQYINVSVMCTECVLILYNTFIMKGE